MTNLCSFEAVVELEFLVHEALASWQMARLDTLRDAWFYD
jgi:hypothetical protein